MIKKTKNNSPINKLAETRWSNRAFSAKEVENDKLNSILEAARWAPSAFNEQPWRFIVAKKGDETYDKIMSTLVHWNQQWAGNAGVLILNITKNKFTRNNKPNATCEYDLGQAVAFMTLETVNQNLFGHQMSGFDAEKAAQIFDISSDYNVVSVMAIGYYGDADKLPSDMLESEKADRNRKSMDAIAFYDNFQN